MRIVHDDLSFIYISLGFCRPQIIILGFTVFIKGIFVFSRDKPPKSAQMALFFSKAMQNSIPYVYKAKSRAASAYLRSATTALGAQSFF